MTESSLKTSCCDVVRAALPACHVIHHQDRFQSGLPDTSISYNGPTSWLEWKHLGLNEKLHGNLRKDQLDELLKLEQATLGRAWVVVFRKGGKFTDVYRPSALLSISRGLVEYVEPTPEPTSNFAESMSEEVRRLHLTGVIRWSGHDHRGIAGLIWHTHHANTDHQHLRR